MCSRCLNLVHIRIDSGFTNSALQNSLTRMTNVGVVREIGKIREKSVNPQLRELISLQLRELSFGNQTFVTHCVTVEKECII